MSKLTKDITSGFMNASMPEIVFKTQITPDFTFSLNNEQPSSSYSYKKPGLVGKFAMWFLSHVVKPEIQVKAGALGLEKTLAPWGRPKENLALPLVLGIGVGAISVGAIAYLLARKKYT